MVALLDRQEHVEQLPTGLGDHKERPYRVTAIDWR